MLARQEVEHLHGAHLVAPPGRPGVARGGEEDLQRPSGLRRHTSFSRWPSFSRLVAQVGAAALGRRDLQRHALDDLQAVAVEGDVLARVVGHQAHLAHAEVAQDLGADAVVALVGAEAELLVGLDRVVPLLLQLVGAQLVHQADAAPLLEQVEEHALALLARSSPAPARAARRSRSAPSRRRRRSGTGCGRAPGPAPRARCRP